MYIYVYIRSLSRKSPTIINIMRMFVQHWCKLTAKESGLECACMNNGDFTVLVSGGGLSEHVYCVASHSKWLTEYNNESASDFALSLTIPPWKLFRWFRRPQLWSTGDWQLFHNNMTPHASRLIQFFGETPNHPGNSALLQPRFDALWLLAFPKPKITFEREKAYNCNWITIKNFF